MTKEEIILHARIAELQDQRKQICKRLDYKEKYEQQMGIVRKSTLKKQINFLEKNLPFAQERNQKLLDDA